MGNYAGALWRTLLLSYCLQYSFCCANNFSITFNPREIIEMKEGNRQTVHFNISHYPIAGDLTIRSDNEEVARIVENHTIALPSPGSDATGRSFSVEGTRLGRAKLSFSIDSREVYNDYHISIIRAPKPADLIFRYTVIVFSTLLTLGFGTQLEWNEIVKIVKKPVNPAIGLVGQYVMMPLLAFALTQIFSMEKGLGLGLLTIGCCPGGSASNIWTHLFHGDLNLSMTMTFISTVLSLGMMPLWLFSLGRFFLDFDRIKLPYENMAISLLSIVVPVILGLILRRWKPRIATIVSRILRPFAALFILFIITFGSYANQYFYKLLGKTYYLIPATILLPSIGFVLGLLISWLLRRDAKRMMTIALETAIQNSTIAIFLVLATFPPPDNDLAAIVPIAVAMFTPVVLVCIYGVFMLHRKLTEDKKYKLETDSLDETYDNTKVIPSENGAVGSVFTIETYRKNGVIS